MPIHTMVTRHFDSGKLIEAYPTLHALRAASMDQAGYRNIRTFVGRDNPDKLVVVTSWDHFRAWEKWRDCATRATFELLLRQFTCCNSSAETFYEGYGSISRAVNM